MREPKIAAISVIATLAVMSLLMLAYIQHAYVPFSSSSSESASTVRNSSSSSHSEVVGATSSSAATVDVVVTGLPITVSLQITLVQPATGGGYAVFKTLGIINGSASATYLLPGIPAFLGSSLIDLQNGTMLIPTHRVQEVNASGQQARFDYLPNYDVSTGTFYHGTLQGGGSISPKPGWYQKGSKLVLTAQPDSGSMFGWWIVTNGTTTSSSVRDFSSATNPLSLALNGPKQVSVVFVPQWHDLNTPGMPGHVTVRNLVPRQVVTLVTPNGNTSAQASGEGLAGMQASLNMTMILGSQVSPVMGHFLVTAPDGKTVIYRSPETTVNTGDVFEF